MIWDYENLLARRLMHWAALPAPFRREVVDGFHSLARPHNPALGEVLDLVVDFRDEIKEAAAQT